MNAMADYQVTIRDLFALLELANLADTQAREPWQKPVDASQEGMFGHIRLAIVDIAGEQIVSHWAETGDVDMTMAVRHGFD